ncbi:hypothetical protein CLOSTMETH_03318 [[Clostridium] methylpentosum DSM 5476]|uniref:Uncharacterized protein n=1 Tax=[Clostridium] methylpentosum DSM 5476 TaxID=537013 RepID=C0EHB8_9FIRM|nr:hypothetical protein CLOSTMETH_03318 [[Clostridium] methylpentosum DSM 5476]
MLIIYKIFQKGRISGLLSRLFLILIEKGEFCVIKKFSTPEDSLFTSQRAKGVSRRFHC